LRGEVEGTKEELKEEKLRYYRTMEGYSNDIAFLQQRLKALIRTNTISRRIEESEVKNLVRRRWEMSQSNTTNSFGSPSKPIQQQKKTKKKRSKKKSTPSSRYYY